MKNTQKSTTILTAALAVSCVGMILSGCAEPGSRPASQPVETATSESQIWMPESISGTSTAESSVAESSVDETTDESAANISATAESEPESPAPEETTTAIQDEASGTASETPDLQAEPTSSRSLYEQFLNNQIRVTVSGSYPEDDYMEPIFQKGSAFTLSEMKEQVSAYFLHPDFSSKTSCDYAEYACVDCPDSAEADRRNLLVRFVGLDIYSPDDDSYAVFIITEDNGRLYVTGDYQCWARSGTDTYANGTLNHYGSGGAGDHYDGLSAILSDGSQVSVYDSEILDGWWTSYISDGLYQEVFGEDMAASLTVSIHTIGDDKYYQYDLSECPEEERPLNENYVNRCQEELGICWVTDEEIQAAVRNRCNALGLDESITQQQKEAVWIPVSFR